MEELIVTYLVNKHSFLSYAYLSDGLLLCLRKVTARPYSGPAESSALSVS